MHNCTLLYDYVTNSCSVKILVTIFQICVCFNEEFFLEQFLEQKLEQNYLNKFSIHHNFSQIFLYLNQL